MHDTPFARLVMLALLWAHAAAASPQLPHDPGAGFVANQGQLPPPVRYYGVAPRSAVYFEPGAVVLDRRPARGETRGVAIRVEFPSSRGRARLEALERGTSVVNDFRGRNPRGWRSGAETYGLVCYREVAPGVDLFYRVNEGRLEYDLVVAPGAALEPARLRYRGAEALEVTSEGGLLVHTAAGDLHEARPRLYQEIDGRQVPVRGGYRLGGGDRLGFWAAGYDPARPLVVDPGMVWSSFLGGSSNDYPHRVATDLDGDVIVAGYTESPDYPVSPGAYQANASQGRDVIVTKLRGDGTSVVWSTFLGGSGVDHGLALALDAGDNVFVAGNTMSADFPVTTGAFRTSYGGGGDAFVAKLTASGGLAFSTYLGGVASDMAAALAVGVSGTVTVAGTTGSTNFPTTAGALKRTLTDGEDGFVTQLNPSGSQLVFSTFVGSGGSDQLSGLALDLQGRPTVVGRTNSAAFPVTPGVFGPTAGSFWDGILVRLDATGSSVVYATYLPGSGYDEPQAVALDALGNAYVVGHTASPNFPTTSGAFRRAKAGGTYDGFAIKASSDARSLLYGTYLGGGAEDYVYGLSVNAVGEVFVTGYTGSSNFPVSSDALDASWGGGNDAFVTRLAPNGGALVYSSYLGGAGADCGRALALRPDGSAVVAGYTTSTTFPITPGSVDQSLSGGGAYYDGFVSVLWAGPGGGVAGVDEGPGPSLMTSPRPNPFRDRTAFTVRPGSPGRVVVRVLDMGGRVVRAVADEWVGAGTRDWAWDGRDERGNDAPPGVFFVETLTAQGRDARRIVRLR